MDDEPLPDGRWVVAPLARVKFAAPGIFENHSDAAIADLQAER